MRVGFVPQAQSFFLSPSHKAEMALISSDNLEQRVLKHTGEIFIWKV